MTRNLLPLRRYMLTGLPPSVRWMRRALEQHEREMVLLRTLTNATPEEAEALRTRAPIALDRLNEALAAGDEQWWAWATNELGSFRPLMILGDK